MKSDDNAGIDPADTTAPAPSDSDPYQMDTMVLPRAAAEAGQAQLSALLDTHVMSRDAIRNLRQGGDDQEAAARAAPTSPPRGDATSPPTVSDMLVPDHIRRKAALALARQAPKMDDARGPVTLKDPGGLDLMLALGVGSMDGDTAHHSLTDTLLIWLVEAISDGVSSAGIDSYCDILLRLAEEVAENGMAGLSALTLRYRRTLLRLDSTQRDNPELSLVLLEWPMLVAAHLADRTDPHAAEAMAGHVVGAEEEQDLEFDGSERLLALLGREVARESAGEPPPPESLIREAGDAVFHAGRTHVFVDSALRRAEQHRAVLTEAARTLGDAAATRLGRSLEALERRLGDLRQTVADLQVLTREHHAALASRASRPARAVFAGLRQAVLAAARERGGAMSISVEGEDVPVDAEAAEALGGPLGDVGWWLARYGIAKAQPRAVGADENVSRIRFARRREALVVDLTMGAAFLESLAEEMTFPEADAWSEHIESELLRMAVVGQTPDSELAGFATRFDALHQAAAGLGGSCRLRYQSGQGVLLQVRVPGWRTYTTGRLIPAGGGVLTVRQTGIDKLVEIAREQVQRADSGVQSVAIDGKRYRALWLLDLLGLPNASDTQDLFDVSAMLTRAGGTQLVVLAAGVSEPLGFSVRGVGERLPRVPGVVGGTVLVGGEVSPLIDLPTVVQVYLRDQLRRSRDESG